MRKTKIVILTICAVTICSISFVLLGCKPNTNNQATYEFDLKYDDIETHNDIVAELRKQNIKFLQDDDNGFISYSAADKDKVDSVIEQIESRPFKILQDEESLHVYTKIMTENKIDHSVRPDRTKNGIYKVVYALKDQEKVTNTVSPIFKEKLMSLYLNTGK